MSDPEARVEIGRINGAWGTAGWVKVYSLTSPAENLFEYRPWLTDGEPGLLHVRRWRRRGPRLVAELAGVADRDAAEALRGLRLFVERARLPAPPPETYYWHDLIGMTVVDRRGRVLGRVTGLLDAGAHDVLQIGPPGGGQSMLVPFVRDRYVLGVDAGRQRIEVDWDPEWLRSE